MKTKQKINWMLYLSTGISFVILFLQSSCKKIEAPLKHVTFTYINRSEVDLTMEVYNEHDEMFKSFNIGEGDSINTHTSHVQGIAYFYFASTTQDVGDSIIVRFENDKCLDYVKHKSDKLFIKDGYDNYSEELIKPGSFTLYYTFTEEDYNLAVDCE